MQGGREEPGDQDLDHWLEFVQEESPERQLIHDAGVQYMMWAL